MDWWRSWHGAPTDLKWMGIAQHANMLLYGSVTSHRLSDVTVTPVTVAGIAWAIMDSASQNIVRGNVTRFDAEAYAIWAGISPEIVKAVIQAMEDKTFIENGFLKNWVQRQGKDNDGSAERTRQWRARLKNGSDVTVNRLSDVTEAKIRVDSSKKERPPIVPQGGVSLATSELPDEEKELQRKFGKLWDAWKPFDMSKGNKQSAFKSFRKIMDSGILLKEIGPKAEAYCERCSSRKTKTQHLVTWLNQRGWEEVDDQPPEYDPCNPRHLHIV